MTERGLSEAMARALDLAWGGWGRVAPNPLVGAVVLQGDTVVGEGFHAAFGGPHAERVALERAGAAAAGSTLVVTLEPCRHTGKQPPCVDAIREADVRRLVVALLDPNPEAGGGAQALAEAGLEVDVGLMAPEVCRQNAGFLHRFRDPTRPWIALKLATSVDGRIADASGTSAWISGERARGYVHWLRAGFDAIAVGGGTVRADDPALTVRGEVEPRRPPRRVVFTRSGALPADAQVLRSTDAAPTTIVTIGDDAAPASTVAGLQARSLREALAALATEGVETLLVEGGGGLAGSLLAEGLVDRFYWIQSPLWLGSGGVPAFGDLPGSPLGDAHRWTVVERRVLEEDTLLVLDRKPCSQD